MAIEENAKEYACLGCEANKVGVSCEYFHPSKCPRASVNYQSYITGAYQQDRIARQEERERCINAAQELVCKQCFENSAVGCRHANDVAKCELLIELRKAMEGGNQNESKTSKES